MEAAQVRQVMPLKAFHLEDYHQLLQKMEKLSQIVQEMETDERFVHLSQQLTELEASSLDKVMCT